MPSRRTRIDRAERAIRASWLERRVVPPNWLRSAAAIAVDAAGPSEPMGVAEVLEELGVTDLRKVAGLPEPVAVLKMGAVYDAEAIRRLARERRRRPPGRLGRERWENTTTKRRG